MMWCPLGLFFPFFMRPEADLFLTCEYLGGISSRWLPQYGILCSVESGDYTVMKFERTRAIWSTSHRKWYEINVPKLPVLRFFWFSRYRVDARNIFLFPLLLSWLVGMQKRRVCLGRALRKAVQTAGNQALNTR